MLAGLAGWLTGLSWPFAIGLALMASHFVWQVARLDIDDPQGCLVLFKSNRDAGLILFLAIVADRALLAA